ncbi:MAG: endonuclease III [Clostridia bacterium]|nr:endonuclease III [Clostridia bacterium]
MKTTDKKGTKSKTQAKAHALFAIDALKKLYPEAVCALESGGDPWKLLVMARLSAQCTDARVNIVCKDLFAALPTAAAMAEAPIEKIEDLIRSCGLYRTKAKSIKEASAILVSDYGGTVPDTMEELLALPGVGRKIANLLLGDIFNKGGIVADTHCIRICGRLGFYPELQKDPKKTEMIMTPLIPKEEQSDFCHRIVQFGRDVCTARSPKCDGCPLGEICLHKQRKDL